MSFIIAISQSISPKLLVTRLLFFCCVEDGVQGAHQLGELSQIINELIDIAIVLLSLEGLHWLDGLQRYLQEVGATSIILFLRRVCRFHGLHRFLLALAFALLVRITQMKCTIALSELCKRSPIVPRAAFNGSRARLRLRFLKQKRCLTSNEFAIHDALEFVRGYTILALVGMWYLSLFVGVWWLFDQ
jgi:hypothetical protein